MSQAFQPVFPKGRSAIPRDGLLLVLALMVLTFIWRVQDLFPAFGRFSPALVATGLGVVLWVLDGDPRRRLHHLGTPTFKLLVALAIIMLLSVPGSLWQGQSIRFLTEDFVFTFVFMLLVAASIRGTRDVEWFALLNVAGAVLYSVVVLLKQKVTSDGRLSGLRYYDANDLAMVLVCTLPLAVYFLRNTVKPITRLAALGAFGLILLTIVKTGSRGGFLGLVVAMGYILFHFRAIKRSTRIGAAITGLIVVTAVGSEAYWTRIQSMVRPEEDYNFSENNLAGRMAIWKRGLGYMASRPLFGVGVRCFPQAEGMLSSVGTQRAAQSQGFKWSVAHNSFVEVGAELGLPALIIFVLALVRSIQMMSRLRARASPGGAITPADAALGQALIGSLLGYVVSGFFLSQGYSAYLYTLFGMVIGLSKLHARTLAPAPAAPTRRSRRSVAPPRLGDAHP